MAKRQQNALFVVFIALIFLFSGNFVFAQTTVFGPRYFVRSTSGFWKSALGVRHLFSAGFTTDLSDFQAGLARLFRVKLEPVQLLHILPSEEAQIAASTTLDGSKLVEQIPWGVRAILPNATPELLKAPLIYKDKEFKPKVAILDTGIASHPDLENQVAQCKDFSNFKKAVIDGECLDKNGHGTHLAGIVAAHGGPQGNGIYGVAPQARLLIYKVCSNDGSCWADDIAVALTSAVNDGADIISLSLGGNAESSLLFHSIRHAAEKGVLVIAAAGNDGPYEDSIDFLAAYASVVAVGALDEEFMVPDWSARGINQITQPVIVEKRDLEFVAPGVNIQSTGKNNEYLTLSGTSVAVPYVAGLAARTWQGDAQKTRDRLAELAQDIVKAEKPEQADVLIGEDNASGFGFPRNSFPAPVELSKDDDVTGVKQ